MNTVGGGGEGAGEARGGAGGESGGGIRFRVGGESGGGSPLARLIANVKEQPLATIDEETRLRHEGIKADQGMKKWYARSLLIGLGVQILIADAAFFFYGAIGVHWNIAEPIMGAWLGATLIEVVGIVTIVVQHFFPDKKAGVE